MQRSPTLRRRRRGEGGILLGLCAGIGEHLGVDPMLVRIVVVALLFLNVGGASVPLLYLLFCLFVPYDDRAAAQ